MKNLDVVTFGESMVLFSPDEKGPLRHIHSFSKSIAGAESNVSIALARLGHNVGWFSRLGDDEFGRYIEFMVRGEGVDVSKIIYDNEYSTGLLFKEIFEHVNPNVYYYRKDSAASHLVPSDIDEAYIRSARILHLTGITPAISETGRESVYRAVDIARNSDVLVSFDPNIRLKLWPKDIAKGVLTDIMSKSNIVFPGIDEGKMLFELDDPEEIIKACHGLGAGIVALKLGKRGCMVSDGNSITKVSSYPVEHIEDSVGAGDGFAAGFLSSYLKGESIESCGDYANGVGAMATLVKGDSEGFPTYRQLLSFMKKMEHIDR